MPVMSCKVDGRSGFKYGKGGHCFTGSGARAKAVKQGQAIEISKHSNNSLQHIITNISGPSRIETLEGREHIVAPMVMITEGVHTGNNGPLYYSQNELGKYPDTWNHKPIVVYHPEANGQPMSACDPVMINSRKVGLVLQTKWDGKLRSEAWIDKARANAIDPRIVERIENSQMMEVSTGMYSDVKFEEGEWNEEKYVGAVHNIRPDHLALLPDGVGACSIADGAGLLQLNMQKGGELSLLEGEMPGIIEAASKEKLQRSGLIDNELSHGDIRSQIFGEIRERFGMDTWIEEVYNSSFVYSRLDKLYSLGYTTSGMEVTLEEGPPVEVLRVTEFRDLNGGSINNQSREDSQVDKKQIVDGLIKNEKTRWKDADKDFLMSLNEEQLKHIQNVTPEPEKPAPTPEPEKPKDPQQQLNTSDAAVQAAAEKGGTGVDAPQTLNQYIANAPPEIREVLEAGVASHSTEKKRLISVITANGKNRFTEDQLSKKPLGELQAIAELARNETPESQDSSYPAYQPSYLGAAGGVPTHNAENKQEALVMAGFNWDKK